MYIHYVKKQRDAGGSDLKKTVDGRWRERRDKERCRTNTKYIYIYMRVDTVQRVDKAERRRGEERTVVCEH